MKWIVAVLTIFWLGLFALGFKSGISQAGWQDRENSAFAYFAAFVVFAIDVAVLMIWGIWALFT